MASEEILREIRDHMARGNELTDAVTHEFRLNREAYRQGLDLTARLIDRNARLIERIDAVFERQARSLDELSAQVRANTEQTNENTKTIRLMRESLLRFLERLDESNGPAPA